MHAAWASKRVWLPFLLAATCLTVGGFTSPLVGAVLVFAAFGFVLDGATIMWSRSGHMSEYRQ